MEMEMDGREPDLVHGHVHRRVVPREPVPVAEHDRQRAAVLGASLHAPRRGLDACCLAKQTLDDLAGALRTARAVSAPAAAATRDLVSRIELHCVLLRIGVRRVADERDARVDLEHRGGGR